MAWPEQARARPRPGRADLRRPAWPQRRRCSARATSAHAAGRVVPARRPTPSDSAEKRTPNKLAIACRGRAVRIVPPVTLRGTVGRPLTVKERIMAGPAPGQIEHYVRMFEQLSDLP